MKKKTEVKNGKAKEVTGKKKPSCRLEVVGYMKRVM